MATWGEFESEAGELAGEVRAAFGRHKHLVLGTLRRDGSPRLSGTEVTIGLGELWVGMMASGVKSRDLRRDPRFGLHSAPLDVEMSDGDAKLSGTAHEVVDREVLAEFWGLLGQETVPGPEEALVFRLELLDASVATVVGQEMVIDAWRAGAEPWQIRRT